MFQLAEIEYGRLPTYKQAAVLDNKHDNKHHHLTKPIHEPGGNDKGNDSDSAFSIKQAKYKLDSELKETDEELKKAVDIRKRIGGHKWQYIVTDSNQVNAFVTEMLPKRIFINMAFYEQLNPSDDELAMVLGKLSLKELQHYVLLFSNIVFVIM